MSRWSAMHRGLRRARAYPLVVLTLFLVAGGCSSRSGSAQGSANVVKVTEKDFWISVKPKRLPAGDVVFSVHNRGPESHELIVVRADDSGLPLRGDGVTVDEEGLEKATVGELEPGAPGSVRRLPVHLAPGRYEMFCNMAGHYLGGMRTELIVSR